MDDLAVGPKVWSTTLLNAQINVYKMGETMYLLAYIVVAIHAF